MVVKYTVRRMSIFFYIGFCRPFSSYLPPSRPRKSELSQFARRYEVKTVSPFLEPQ
jgi:hypothetical protein